MPVWIRDLCNGIIHTARTVVTCTHLYFDHIAFTSSSSRNPSSRRNALYKHFCTESECRRKLRKYMRRFGRNALPWVGLHLIAISVPSTSGATLVLLLLQMTVMILTTLSNSLTLDKLIITLIPYRVDPRGLNTVVNQALCRCVTGFLLLLIGSGTLLLGSPGIFISLWITSLLCGIYVLAAQFHCLSYRRLVEVVDSNLCYMVGVGLPLGVPFFLTTYALANAIYTITLPLCVISYGLHRPYSQLYKPLTAHYKVRMFHKHTPTELLECRRCVLCRGSIQPMAHVDHFAVRVVLVLFRLCRRSRSCAVSPEPPSIQ